MQPVSGTEGHIQAKVLVITTVQLYVVILCTFEIVF